MSDPIILKSNKIPTYNFGVVCDDHEMQITHILRAEEHISNTPYQLAIMEALGYNLNDIQYGHLSIVVDENGKKLSKRNKDLIQFIHEYQALGYYPMAIVNFLALLG
jgi:glutamyl-tRNA synthetase